MDRLYWLDQIKLQDRTKVGDKAFYLSKIRQRGYPVVPGFVVPEEVLRLFLATINSSDLLVAHLPDSSLHLDVGNWRQLQQVAFRLRQEIMNAPVPPHWVSTIFTAAQEWQGSHLILRPTLAIPKLRNTSGLLESVFCNCNEEAIAIALKEVWSQLFRAKSLFYWRRMGINLQQVNLAILVQPVENAIASGLLKVNTSGWKIEATWGLGIAIAQGEVLPDTYHVQQHTGVVLERHLGNKMLAYRLNHGTPQDSHQPILPSILTIDHNCLSAYLLEETQQKQYALPEASLQQMITLGHQLVSELGRHFTIEWTIAEHNSVPHLYITQVNTPQLAIPSLQFIKGVGAAGGRVTANAHVVVNTQSKPEQLPKGIILVVPQITPDWLPLLQQVAGVVTTQGGLTSHAAILARELGIPAVVSATDATLLIQNGERLLLDGDRGEVYRMRADEANQEETPHIHVPQLTRTPETVVAPQFPMIATQLLVNLSQPSLIEQVQKLPVDGVGLLRSELMLIPLLKGQHPHLWLLEGKQTELLEKLTEQIIQFARGFAPRPVFYRSLDWRSHELSTHPSPPSAKSILGDRGTFSYIQNAEVFDLELTALANVQKAGYSNIHLLLPFVRSVPEFTFCRQKVEQMGLTQIPQFQLWIMAEVPSVLFLLPEYVKAGVAGISIGTNDLTQLLLGVDREHPQLTRVLNERHPAVMGAIAQFIQMAKTAGIPCSICGQAPAIYPEIIDQLVQWGITAISVEPEALERTYQAIARAEQRLLLAAAQRQLSN
ncbi:phosphoenolpyruvate synthase/pyruvate phosphate dikinase [Nostoc sp. PCC 7524]|uniref:putative PEP-binding protein n=1 Tax=Nostoc sp. (strain ATCC 29411 / PCC 7524) TaxID=28072 RepID=UPI00029F0012|nr:putative PEP-binding protein [Nostoc sp. PCC 7524]AFY49154.1 phosphoenolpyruvate synthase/pyruvate phosphate dikinase [Nostoc sp. PCC 7524]